MATPTVEQVTQILVSQFLPPPHRAFLQPILTPTSASQRLPPILALAATAKHRLLSSDLTAFNVLDARKALAFPPNTGDVKVASKQLAWDVVVQVLDIEDAGRSKWDQVEALESERKGEKTKGRQVIRVVGPPADGEPASTAATQFQGTQAPAAAAAQVKSSGPFKVLFQDFKGVRVYGFELKRVDKIGYPGNGAMSIGCKILLKKGSKVARGMILLEPATVRVLGGKIEGYDKKWREGREKSLREAVGDRRRRDEDDPE